MDLLRSLPIGLYLEKPITWLHQLDPRVKLAWLMTFLVSPMRANPLWQLGIVVILILLTITTRIPLRVWRQQMGWLIILSILIFIITAIAPDALTVNTQPRLLDGDVSLVQPTDYNYILWDKGRLITRRSVELGIRISALVFILIYSTNLYLLTTAPEEMTTGLEYLLEPLRYLKLPITEIMLTLTLSLRFIPLVLEELQNLVRSIRTRAINWKKLGLKRALQVCLVVVEKLLENLLMRAEEIAVAMEVRGFTNPNEHRVQWYQLRLIEWDWLALAILIPFWWARFILGRM
jgi:energy-coupling factor transport system permease protein